MPVLTSSVHAHILTKPSRAGFVVSRLELIEPGAATCAYRHAWAVFKKVGTYVHGTSTSLMYHRGFLLVVAKILPSKASANNSIYR